MRRTANADLPAFNKIDARGAGFDAHLLPLRRTVFAWPWTTSTLMGPVTLIASPSMIPTESEGGSSGRAAAAAISAAQRMAIHAAGTAARRWHPFELEQAVTR